MNIQIQVKKKHETKFSAMYMKYILPLCALARLNSLAKTHKH